MATMPPKIDKRPIKSSDQSTDYRAICQRNLGVYCRFVSPGFALPPHIIRIAKALERVERGEVKKLIISVPPRHGKSVLSSEHFPAWYLSRNPSKQFIFASYNATYASEYTTKILRLLKSDRHRAVFPELKLTQERADRIETDKAGYYVSTGVMGTLTGRGGHVLLIDDPIKNREEADSQVYRDKTWDWFLSTAYTRLEPGASVVVIMTRWHEDDIIGRIKNNLTGEPWKEIRLPAINDKGEPLWPERYSLEALKEIRGRNEYDWQCLYQQEPLPPDGIIVRPEWLKSGLSTKRDPYKVKMIAIDPAVGGDEQDDETAICVGGVGYDGDDRIDEIETIYGHFTKEQIITITKSLYQKHNAELIGIEDVQAQKWLIQDLQREGLPAIGLPPRGNDKVARFFGVSDFFTRGLVHINTPKLREQCLKFRGKSEKNDLFDSLIYFLIMRRDYTTQRVRKDPPKKYANDFEYHWAKEIENYHEQYGVGTDSSNSEYI